MKFEARNLEHWDYQLYSTYEYLTPIKLDKELNLGAIKLNSAGMLTIGRNYLWDGATWAINTESNKRASCVHDALCELIAVGLLDGKYRKVADKLYLKLCLEDKMPKWRAYPEYFMIRQYVNFKYNY